MRFILGKLRMAGLLVLLVGALSVSGKMLLAPVPIESPLAPVIFPAEPPIPGWQKVDLQTDRALPNTARYHQGDLVMELQFIPDLPVHYVYNPQLELRFLPRGHLPLDAGLHFYLSGRDGVITNLRSQPPLDTLIEHRKASSRSAHGIWAADQQWHLSTVMTPAGKTAMDTRSVARQLHLDPLTPVRLWQWLLGRVALPDRRCLLIHLSLPLGTRAQEENRRVLEDAWTEWQRAWQPVFPD